MLFVAPAVAEILKAPEAAFDGTAAYVYVCAAGAVFIVAFNLLGRIFRGLGDSKRSPYSLPVLPACSTLREIYCWWCPLLVWV